MKKFLKPMIVLLLLVVVSYPAKVYAWETDRHASAFCDGQNAKVRVTFKNQETGQDKCMSVIATDVNTGKSVDLGQVNPGEKKIGIIDLGINNTAAGKVRFDISWCSGEEGQETKYSSHSDEICKKDVNGDEDENGNGGEADENGDENGGGVGGITDEGGDESEDKKSERLEVNKKVRIGEDEKYSSKAVGVNQSEIITFLLEIRNTGEKNIQDIDVDDDLPDELLLISGNLNTTVSEIKDGSGKNLFIVAKVKDGVNLAGKCVTNKVKISWDDESESDEATVCFEDKELTELPKTGLDSSILSALGAISLIMGTSIKVYASLKKG